MIECGLDFPGLRPGIVAGSCEHDKETVT